MPLHTQIYEKFDSRFLADWLELWRESGYAHFYNSPRWFLACTRAVPSAVYRVIAVRSDEGRLEAVLPLYKERLFGLLAQACPVGKHLSKSALLLRKEDPRVLAALVGRLCEGGSFYLSEVPARLAWAIRESGRGIIVREASKNPYIPLSGDPFSFMSKNQRSKLFGRVKKYGNLLSFKTYRGSEEGLEIAFAIDARSSKRREGKAVFKVGPFRKFFRQVVAEYGEQVTVDVVYFDGVPVVFSINFVHGKTYQAVKTAYDRDYPFLAPGKLILYFMLKRLKDEGQMEVFDFSQGINTLKEEFTPLFYRQFDVYYGQNALVSHWWKAANHTYQSLQKNKAFYGSYLKVKKALIRIKDLLSSDNASRDAAGAAGEKEKSASAMSPKPLIRR